MAKKGINLEMVNCALLVVILILVIYCCLRNNEGFKYHDVSSHNDQKQDCMEKCKGLHKNDDKGLMDCMESCM